MAGLVRWPVRWQGWSGGKWDGKAGQAASEMAGLFRWPVRWQGWLGGQ